MSPGGIIVHDVEINDSAGADNHNVDFAIIQ
jgi:hypothetical protein